MPYKDKELGKQKAKEYYIKNREKIRERQHKWYIDKKKYIINKTTANRDKRKYFITKDEYNSMFSKQEFCCAICKTKENYRGKIKDRFCIDHDHKTLEVRGLLCHRCNKILGLVGDNVNVLESAIEYLNAGKDVING